MAWSEVVKDQWKRVPRQSWMGLALLGVVGLLGGCVGTPLIPTVSWTSSSQVVLESATTVLVSAQLSRPSREIVSVPFSVSGTATPGVDYTGPQPAAALSIPAGSLSASLRFNVVDDVQTESAEAIVVTMGTPTSAVKGSIATHTLVIIDNDP